MTDIADKSELTPLFARPGESAPRDLYSLGYEQMLPETAYQMVHDEAMLDGNARLNLATFVSTFDGAHANPPVCGVLRQEHDRQGRVSADRRHRGAVRAHPGRPLACTLAPTPSERSAIGSSEACMLGGLAFKRIWQNRRRRRESR